MNINYRAITASLVRELLQNTIDYTEFLGRLPEYGQDKDVVAIIDLLEHRPRTTGWFGGRVDSQEILDYDLAINQILTKLESTQKI